MSARCLYIIIASESNRVSVIIIVIIIMFDPLAVTRNEMSSI